MLDFPYFDLDEHFKLTAVQLRKQEILDTDQRSIQQINCIGKISANARVFVSIEKSKEKS